MESQRPTTEQERLFYLSTYLDFVSDSFENVVESTLDNAITNTINIQKETDLKSENKINIVSDDPYENMLNETGAYYASLDKLENKEIVFALYELKIMYLCKHFEIKLKELARESFTDWQTDKEVFKWDDIINFYKSKDINPKLLNNYQSVYDLIRVNNSLKHSGKKIGVKINNISEFKKADRLESEHLKVFYLRVNEAPKEFINELASIINNKLFPFQVSDYEFDESDIEIDF